MQYSNKYKTDHAASDMPTQGCGRVTRVHRTVMAAIGIGLLAVSLAACAPTGPEPVALDQNPGSNGAPTASGS